MLNIKEWKRKSGESIKSFLKRMPHIDTEYSRERCILDAECAAAVAEIEAFRDESKALVTVAVVVNNSPAHMIEIKKRLESHPEALKVKIVESELDVQSIRDGRYHVYLGTPSRLIWGWRTARPNIGLISVNGNLSRNQQIQLLNRFANFDEQSVQFNGVMLRTQLDVIERMNLHNDPMVRAEFNQTNK